jgi:hypothetical protein
VLSSLYWRLLSSFNLYMMLHVVLHLGHGLEPWQPRRPKWHCPRRRRGGSRADTRTWGDFISLFKVLSVKMQGPVCNSCVFLGPVVISSVSVSVAINIALCSKKNVVLHFMVWLYIWRVFTDAPWSEEHHW